MRDYLKEFDDFFEEGEKEMRDITFDSYDAKRDFLNSRSIARRNKYESLMNEKLANLDDAEKYLQKAFDKYKNEGKDYLLRGAIEQVIRVHPVFGVDILMRVCFPLEKDIKAQTDS